MKTHLSGLLLVLMATLGCATVERVDPTQSLAINALASVQERSILEQREFCGWIYSIGGNLRVTPIARGEFDLCQMPTPPRGATVVASFHTHGNHSPDYYSEVPSLQDVLGDFSTDTLGYVATPGGRVWVIDPRTRVISQLCGEKCVQQDKNYRAEDYPLIPESFTIEQLFYYFL